MNHALVELLAAKLLSCIPSLPLGLVRAGGGQKSLFAIRKSRLLPSIQREQTPVLNAVYHANDAIATFAPYTFAFRAFVLAAWYHGNALSRCHAIALSHYHAIALSRTLAIMLSGSGPVGDDGLWYHQLEDFFRFFCSPS